MKALNVIFPISLFILFIGFSASMPEPRNPPTGFTGAPGELTCQNKDCHGGGNYIGSVDISGIPDTILANTEYEITILNKSDSAVRTGFQLTVIDDDLKFTGMLSMIMGETVSIAKDPGTLRTYARQSAAKFFNGGEARWRFKWTSPASLPTDSLSFYFVALMGNGDGNKTKDNVIAAKKRYFFKMPVGTAGDELNNADIQLIQTSNFLVVSGKDADQISAMQLYSLGGSKMYQSNASGVKMIRTDQLMPGIYVLQYKFKERLFSKKIILN